MQRNSNKEKAAFWWLAVLLIISFVSQGQAFAAKTPAVVVDMDAGQTINLVVGKMGKLKSRKKVARYNMTNPAVAKVVGPTKTQSRNMVYFNTISAGTTQLTLWDDDNRILGIFNIVVSLDIAELKKKLHDIFPDENVQVRSSDNYITLNGTVTDTSRMTKVVALAESYAAEPGKVLNMLKIGGIQQVMLEVKVAEISRSVGKELGINFTALSDDGDNFVANTINNLVGAQNALFNFLGDGDLSLYIKALEDEGLIKILAEPTLIALSGQNASFLAGGEFPVPTDAGDGATAIEWKDYGVSLNFTPTVLGDGNLSMRVNPEISELDFSNATFQNGFLIPGLETRRMSTVIEMKDGQSYSIAGLLKSTVRESISKFPILGNIPILGALFRSTSFQKNETELVVLVTPHLVKPLDIDNQPLPTDSFIEPNTFELLLLGMLEGRPPAPRQESIGLEGDFGYIIPE